MEGLVIGTMVLYHTAQDILTEKNLTVNWRELFKSHCKLKFLVLLNRSTTAGLVTLKQYCNRRESIHNVPVLTAGGKSNIREAERLSSEPENLHVVSSCFSFSSSLIICLHATDASLYKMKKKNHLLVAQVTGMLRNNHAQFNLQRNLTLLPILQG
eukprot:g56110.t1